MDSTMSWAFAVCLLLATNPVLNGADRNAVVTVACDFEAPCEGVTVSGPWQRAEPGPVTDTLFPVADHTTNTDNGSYLYMTSDTAQNGVLRTGILDLQQPECLHFFYVMNGPPGVRRLANLNVILSMGTADDHMEKSWKEIMGNFGREWQEVTVDLPVGKYFLAIEAYIIDYRHDRLIAIDDVTISNCSDSALRNVSVDILDQCDFENRYMCKYSDSVTDLHVWDRIRPGYRRLPATDHTGPDILGHYMFIELTAAETAGNLISPVLHVPPDRHYCLDFFYSTRMELSSAVMYVYAVNVSTPTTGINVVWSRQGDVTVGAKTSWQWAAVALRPGTYSLVFELRVYPGLIHRAVFMAALDDITISSCDYLQGPHGQDMVIKGTATAEEYSTTYRCSFESGDFCGAEVETSHNALWWDIRPDGFAHVWTGAVQNHVFLYFEAPPVHIMTNHLLSALLRLPRIWAYEKLCLMFSYLMTGNSEDTFEVRLHGTMSGRKYQHLWHHVGDNGDQWETVLVKLPFTDFNIYFVATKASTDVIHLAVDDIFVDSCEDLRDKIKGLTRKRKQLKDGSNSGFSRSAAPYRPSLPEVTALENANLTGTTTMDTINPTSPSSAATLPGGTGSRVLLTVPAWVYVYLLVPCAG